MTCRAPVRPRGITEKCQAEQKFALDDFGTAYASLSYLRSFPFDKIKIDRTFIADLDNPKRKDCTAIIQAVAGLAKQMQMSTVAEGVETLAQLKTVTGAGCEEVQGSISASRCRPARCEQLVVENQLAAGEGVTSMLSTSSRGLIIRPIWLGSSGR